MEQGKDAEFECGADGSPKPLVFWTIEGNRSLLLPGSKTSRFLVSPTVDGRVVLTIESTTKNDSGMVIICSAVNQAGSLTARVKLSVMSSEDQPPPVIVHVPMNQTLPLRSMATLPCRAIGSPPPIISWYREGIPVVSGRDRANISETGTLHIQGKF